MALLAPESTVVLRDGREAVVRSARSGDAKPLTRLLDAIAAEPEVTLMLQPGQISAREWRRRISAAADSEAGLFLVAVAEGRLVGNLGLVADPHPASAHVRVLGMSVARDARGLGVGTALLDVALAWARRRGVEKLELSVFAHNARALAFYERRGFVREGLRRRQLVRGDEYHDEVLMARFLDAES